LLDSQLLMESKVFKNYVLFAPEYESLNSSKMSLARIFNIDFSRIFP